MLERQLERERQAIKERFTRFTQPNHLLLDAWQKKTTYTQDVIHFSSGRLSCWVIDRDLRLKNDWYWFAELLILVLQITKYSVKSIWLLLEPSQDFRSQVNISIIIVESNPWVWSVENSEFRSGIKSFAKITRGNDLNWSLLCVLENFSIRLK